MKKFIISLLLIITTQFLVAQNIVAKLKFNEAEQAYNNGDYQNTIKKLNEAEELLKSTNPKILYLKITALFNTIEKGDVENYNGIENLRKFTTKYLSEYENVPNIENKYRDIYKIDKELKNYPHSEQDFEIWINKNLDLEQKKNEDKKLLAVMLNQVTEKVKHYKWIPNLTEEEFLRYNLEIGNYKWTRDAYQDMIVVMRKTGTALSVKGYSPDGPASYTIDKSGIVQYYSYNITTVKNKIEESQKYFDEMKNEAAKYGKYFALKDKVFTISVPKSVDEPDEIAYFINVQLIQVDKWSFMSVFFTTDQKK